MTRTTRSGAVFSPYGLAAPVLCNVDVADLLRIRFAELDAQQDEDGSGDELDVDSIGTAPHVDYMPASPASSFRPTTDAAPTSPYRNARQKGSHLRRKRKHVDSSHPALTEKPVHARHRAQALNQTIHVNFDAAELPVNASGFGGLQQSLAKDGRSAEELCALPGWRYISCPAHGGAVPIVDRHGRMMVLIGGMPQDAERWQTEVAVPLAEAIEEGAASLPFSASKLDHKRGRGFAALASGPSHGGGETRPGNRVLTKCERTFMDRLLLHPSLLRVSGFMNQLLSTYNPSLFAELTQHQNLLHAREPQLRRNFSNSAWSSLTVNCGPQTTTDPHVDSANQPASWCPVAAVGPFNPRTGGQLVLPDLKLVIEFPPGCIIFLPSALLVHYNCPIQPGEKRYSITQYTAGGLFRWVANGFQTQETFLACASASEREMWWADRKTRWERGLKFFPVIV